MIGEFHEPVDRDGLALRRLLSQERVRRFGAIPDSGEEWRRQMAEVAALLGVVSPWGAS